MRTPELLQRQCASVNAIFHTIADDLSQEEWTTRILPETNLLGFDLWHVARTQDWAFHTLIRGVPEVINIPTWAGMRAWTTPGIGVGMTQQEADQLAQAITKAEVIAYADAVHTTLMEWLAAIHELTLDETPDIPAHYQEHPEYLTPAMQAEVPWVAEHPPVWRCLMPGMAHVRDHLAEMNLLKRLWRHQQDSLSISSREHAPS